MSDTPKTEAPPVPPTDDLAPSALAPHLQDHRPRFAPITVAALGGELRIRRMQPEQLFKQVGIFEGAEIDPKHPQIREKGDKQQLCQFIQRCLVSADSNHLLLPGGRGLLQLLTLPDALIVSIAKQIATFQEL